MRRLYIVAGLALVISGCSSSALARPVEMKVAAPVVAPIFNLSINKPLVDNTLLGKQAVAVEIAKRNLAKMTSVIKKVKSRIGKTWYVFSGDSPRGWDCSGLTRWAYAQLGIDIPHSATAQSKIGKRVSEPQIGDLVLFGYKGSKSYYHAALYIGNGQVIHAGFRRGTTTQIIGLDSAAFKGSRISFVRLLNTQP